LALPAVKSRVVCKARPDLIFKHMHGKIRGKDVQIAMPEDSRLAAGLAVSRCLPPYSAKAAKPLKDQKPPADSRVQFVGEQGEEDAPIEVLNHLASAIRMCQGLVDMPANAIHPNSIQDFVRASVVDVPDVTVQIIAGEDLRDLGYGGLWNVGRSSAAHRPPCLVVLTHNPNKTEIGGGVAFVGKGITFDTGGAALKSAANMVGMKRDMGGAAGVFGAWLAAVKCGGLPLKQPLHCVLCLAENGIGPDMMLHDDIITHYSGLTTEVSNTDAEGRLVLADGVAHAAKHLKPDLIVDMATLTGAQRISTGRHFSTFLATDEELEQEVIDAGRRSGEGAHPGLFAPELLLSEFNSDLADMFNHVKDANNASASCAGLFMYKHLDHVGYKGRWLHIDMAGPVCSGNYATGYGVGLLCAHLGII